MYTLLTAAPVDRIMDFDAQTLFSMGIMFFNTAILVFCLWKLLYGPVLVILDKRKNDIQSKINHATAMLKEAEELKQSNANIMQNADAEKAAIIEAARKTAKAEADQIVAAAKEDATRIKESAAREIELQKSKIESEMKSQILDISALIAGKYVEATMDTTLQAKLLNDAIEDLGDATWLS